jgi:dihydrolipoamide dehydrogenase
MKKFDIVVIGSGPGGYVAAIRAAQQGANVALVEADSLGGTCLNRGCIPTKTLLACSERWSKIQDSQDFGIEVSKACFSYEKMVERKNNLVNQIRKNLKGLIEANKINIIHGFAKIQSSHQIKILGDDPQIIKTKHIILSTGSEPREIPGMVPDHKTIFDSTSLLEQTKLPQSLIIIGGGVIGCEFASMYNDLGVEVTIIEALDSLISLEGKDTSKALQDAFEKKGIKILTNSMIKKLSSEKNGVKAFLNDGSELCGSCALVSVGRKINTDKIGLENVGIATTKSGFIEINDHMQTKEPHIYAIGDITGKALLAHVASHQGLVAADHCCGEDSHINYDVIPSVTYTHPEVATVGYTLEEAQKDGLQASVAAFPFHALGKSQASKETQGFAQIVIEKNTQRILGGQVVGHEAGTLIAELSVAMQNELTLESISETIHAHPTISEAWLEASLLGQGKPLHLPPIKRKK